MGNMYDDTRVVDASPGDDHGIWYQDINSINDEIAAIMDDREKSYFYNFQTYTTSWDSHSSGYHVCTAGAGQTADIYVHLPVGSVIRETGVVCSGNAAAAGGDVYFRQRYIDGSLILTHDITGVANPFATVGGPAHGNAVTYTQTVAHADLPLTIEPLHYYYFTLFSADLESRVWNIWLKVAECDH